MTTNDGARVTIWTTFGEGEISEQVDLDLLSPAGQALIERCQALREDLGVTSLVLELNYGGQLPMERVAQSMRLLADKVMPALR